jgi:adenylosuccinate lyase
MGEPNLSLPGNPRYQPKQLIPIWGYDNLFSALAEVEIATLKTLAEFGIIPEEDIAVLTPKMEEDLLAIKTSAVDHVERTITKHDIRAWIKLAKDIVGPALGKWIHIPLTSYDALDTARSLQYKRAYYEVIKPELKNLLQLMANQVERFADQLQVGRTHGQHALPITVGFWMANILHRMLYNISIIDQSASQLRGKISGAVGAHNAQVAIGLDPIAFEASVLGKLGLKPAEISSQILPPEPLMYFLFSCLGLSATFGQFGRDARHLMRSEIGEVREEFVSGQVGSSTMAHKRNPINFENLEGTWLKSRNEIGKLLDTLISEHQRDLVASSIARDLPVIVINLIQQINTLLRVNKQTGKTFIESLSVDEIRCQENFGQNANLLMAEPLYILLQMAGYEGDAHDVVNHKVVPLALANDKPLTEIVRQAAAFDEELEEALDRIPPELWSALDRPEEYTGDAAQRARDAAQAARYIIERM